MADTKTLSKKSLTNLFAEAGERKIVLQGPSTKLQDSRFQIAEVGTDHVVIKLLGDGEVLVIPFSGISTLKFERQVLTITYR